MEQKEKKTDIRKTKAFRSIRKSLMEQLERGGNDTAHFEALVADYMKLYEVKERAYRDIQERGLYVEYRNSEFQYGTKKNDSVDQMLKAEQQMLKILDSLGIKPEAGLMISDDDL